MRKRRFTEEQIAKILKEADAGVPTKDLCRQHSISDATFYTWRKKYGGLDVSDAKKLRALDDENRRLKRIVADQALEIAAIKDVLTKKW